MMIAFDTYKSNTGESRFPNGRQMPNRSEFLLSINFGSDTAIHHVTRAYDLDGFTPRFNLTDPLYQKYKSTVSDGAPWNEMDWYNDGLLLTKSHIGRLPVEHAENFTAGQRSAVAWNGNKLKVRIPWTMLYFNDPTQMRVNDGAISYDGGYSFDIVTTKSDGIGLSVYFRNEVTSTMSRYNWEPWLITPKTVMREKKAYEIIKDQLPLIPGFAN
jgi:hypothetical protein